MRAILVALAVVLLASCDPPDDFTPEAVAGVNDHDLEVVLQEQWDIDAEWESEWEFDDLQPDADALDARQIANVEAARQIDTEDLSPDDRLTLEIYLERYGSVVATIPCDRAAGLSGPRSRARLLDAQLSSRRARALAGDDQPTISRACYQAYIRFHTTTDLSPEEIHQIGLDELAGVEAEINIVGARMYGTTNLAELRAHLDADPAQRFASLDEIMTTAQALVDQSVAASTPVFASMPTLPLVLTASEGGSAAYQGPWKERAFGEYLVASWPVEAQRRYQLPSVTIHEGIPGHHLERGRDFEHVELPWMRRTGADTVYVEGWGFYTEYLAEDLGLYADDAARLGALSNRALRASRLVVDTGLHALGWDHDRAVAFLTEHTLEPPEYVEIQVNRYTRWPGQALAYMLGAREILRLRAEAEARLGDRFSLRDFHERFLSAGSLPLGLLTAHMETWIDEQAGR